MVKTIKKQYAVLTKSDHSYFIDEYDTLEECINHETYGMDSYIVKKANIKVIDEEE